MMLPKARVDQVLAVGTTKFLKFPLFSVGSECSVDQRPGRRVGCFLKPEQAHGGLGRTITRLMYETRVYVAGVEHHESGDESGMNRNRNYLAAAIVLREVMRQGQQFPASQFATICVVFDPLVAGALVDAKRCAVGIASSDQAIRTRPARTG